MAKRFSFDAIFKAEDQITAPVRKMQRSVLRFTQSSIRGLKSVNRVLGRTIKGFKRGVVAVAKFAAIGIGGLIAGVTLLIRQFSKIEDAEAAFTPLLGGAKKAKKMVQELNNTAASTPFQFETLAKAANQLLPVMNANIKLTIKTIRMLGDTAGGNAQKLESITRGFTKAMLKGKVDMESLNMIAEAGVPIFTELADSMGVKVNTAFFKMISAGKVATKDLTKAFEKMTNKGGIFFEGMIIASKTTSGMWSTLKDNISLTAATLGSILAPQVKKMILSATEMAKKIKNWVNNNKELLQSKFKEFLVSAKKGIDGLVTAFNFLIEHRKTILIITAAVVGFITVVKILTGVLTIMNLVMMANPIVLITLAAIAAFTALVIWIDDVANAFNGMSPFLKIVLFQFGLIIDAIKFIKNNAGAVFDFGAKIARSLSFVSGDKEVNNIVTPQERNARVIEERRKTSTATVTIQDATGRAELTKGSLGNSIMLQSSGAFN